MKIAVIVGSTRPQRRAPLVARWVAETGQAHLGSRHPDVSLDVLDIADFDLPLLDEPVPAAIGEIANEHTRRWSAAVSSYDGFVVVTPEYNHSFPAALKNAIDYLFSEWSNKAVGFVGYGLHGGSRGIEQLRLSVCEVGMADVRTQVLLSLFEDFTFSDITQPGSLTPREHQAEDLGRMLGEVVAWAGALRTLRESPTP